MILVLVLTAHGLDENWVTTEAIILCSAELSWVWRSEQGVRCSWWL